LEVHPPAGIREKIQGGPPWRGYPFLRDVELQKRKRNEKKKKSQYELCVNERKGLLCLGGGGTK